MTKNRKIIFLNVTLNVNGGRNKKRVKVSDGDWRMSFGLNGLII